MYQESVFAVWRRFAIWSILALVGLLVLIGFGGYSGALLLGWAVGSVFAATLILFRNKN